MVRLIDFDKLDVIKIQENELKIINITIQQENITYQSIEKMYDLFSKNITEAINSTTIDLNDNLYFKINITDSTLNKDGCNLLYQLCSNIIGANIVTNDMRNREPRLRIPPILNTKGFLGLLWIKRMVNYKTISNKIGGSIIINNLEGKII